MVTRAMDQVEDTTEKLAHTVTSPVRRASGFVQGSPLDWAPILTEAQARWRNPSDEMFI